MQRIVTIFSRNQIRKYFTPISKRFPITVILTVETDVMIEIEFPENN